MISTRVFSQNIHEPARMVERYLPESSFDVVYQVYNNLANIKAIADNLRTFASVSSNAQNIAQVKEHLIGIQAVADKLDSLVQLADSVDYLKTVEPDLNKLVSDIRDIKADYDLFNRSVYSLEESIKKLSLHAIATLNEHLKKTKEEFSKVIEERESVLKELTKKVHNDLDEISDAIVESYNMKQELQTYRCYILRNNAYVAVQDYKHSPDSKTKARALKAIAMSEEVGNDESINKLRMSEA